MYLQVMGTPGVFGEKAELEALGRVMGRKVSLFYYHGERVDAKGQQQPAEVFEAPGIKGTRAVNLLHSVAGRHFCPMIRRDLLKKDSTATKHIRGNSLETTHDLTPGKVLPPPIGQCAFVFSVVDSICSAVWRRPHPPAYSGAGVCG